MKKISLFKFGMTMFITLVFVSCNKDSEKAPVVPDQQVETMSGMISENGANPDEVMMVASATDAKSFTATNSANDIGTRKGHFLYSESNEAGVNQIFVYRINRDGSLTSQGSTPSGGAGAGTGLGSEGALVLSGDHKWLFAVNAGSNSVSSFRVNDDGSLTLAHTESSEGKKPVSVSVHGTLLYVLNFDSDNIHGFRVGEDGTLTHIEGSTRPLSGTGVVPPQISFTPNGNWLLVTEKATNNISSFKVGNDGSVSPDVVTASTGQTPFGFDFGRDDFMIVSNAAGGAAGAGSVTSYQIGGNGVPHEVNGAVPNFQGAPCWVATTKFGRFAFVSNTGSNSISSYYVAPGGRLNLISKAAATTDNSPADIVVAANNYNVYNLNVKSGTIGEYHRTLLGGLQSIGFVSGLPAPTTGLATY
jgi:6-phosphogluconolactonase